MIAGVILQRPAEGAGHLELHSGVGGMELEEVGGTGGVGAVV